MTATAAEYAVVGLLIGVAIVAIVRFERFCLRDLAQASDVELRYLNRSGWLAVIVVSIPFGGLFYLSFGRQR